MISTVDEANALLRRCTYNHVWTDEVSWELRQAGAQDKYMMYIRYSKHPDTRQRYHHKVFQSVSYLLGEENSLIDLPCREEDLVQLAYHMLLAVEVHEVGERFAVDQAAIFHPHAQDNGTWCEGLKGETWVNPLNHPLEPGRKPVEFNLARRIDTWKRGFK